MREVAKGAVERRDRRVRRKWRRRERYRANDTSGARLNLFTCISAEDTLWSSSALGEVEECALFFLSLFFREREETGTGSEIDTYDFRG